MLAANFRPADGLQATGSTEHQEDEPDLLELNSSENGKAVSANSARSIASMPCGPQRAACGTVTGQDDEPRPNDNNGAGPAYGTDAERVGHVGRRLPPNRKRRGGQWSTSVLRRIVWNHAVRGQHVPQRSNKISRRNAPGPPAPSIQTSKHFRPCLHGVGYRKDQHGKQDFSHARRIH